MKGSEQLQVLTALPRYPLARSLVIVSKIRSVSISVIQYLASQFPEFTRSMK
jgi:hypothetical protein